MPTIKPLLRSLPLLLLSLFFNYYSASAQSPTRTYDTTIGGWNAVVTHRADFNWQKDSAQAIVFLPALGEVGTDVGKLKLNGPHYWMSRGWNGEVVLGNGVHYPVIISLQPPSAFARPVSVKSRLDAIKSRYRVRQRGLHLAGVSQGAWVANIFVTYRPAAGNDSYGRMIRSIVNVQGVVPSDSYDAMLPFPARFGAWAKTGGRELAFEQLLDFRDMVRLVKSMNDSVPGSGNYVQTNLAGGGHTAFNDFFNPANAQWVAGASGVVQASPGVRMNVYQWMLRNGDTTSGAVAPAPVNKLPIVNAGKDTTFNLPASQVVLKGAASDADGTIASVRWTQLVGPNNAVITGAASLQATFSGLIKGLYRFVLTATDNNGGTGRDTVAVTLLDAPVTINKAPVANAGAAQVITLPVFSVKLNGTASADPDGSITAYQWTMVSGPAAATITNGNTATATASSLKAGAYVFRLRVTDNSGATDSALTQVTVNAATALAPKVQLDRDTTLPLKQTSVTAFQPKATINGTYTSLQWRQISGAALSFSGTAVAQPVVSGFKPGFYSLVLTASNGNAAGADTLNIRVVDYQKKAETLCRTGVPKVWTLKPTSATEVFYPYLRRSGFAIQGGDTIQVPRNPQNNGVYTGIHLGDFGGSKGCPVVVVPTGGAVVLSGANAYFRIGGADSNFVAHAVIDGTVLRGKGVRYGFVVDNNQLTQPNANGSGISGNLISDLTVKGLAVRNMAVGVFFKINSDSTRPWKVMDNFRMKNIRVLDNYFNRINGETMYLGHTDVAGSYQGGNDGPTVRMDSLEVAFNFIDSSSWDGIQTSSARYTTIHDNIVLRAGQLNMSSQNIGIFLGGNTTGRIYNNVLFNSPEGIKTFGYGNTEITNNYVDSTYTGRGTSDGIYADQKNGNIAETNPPLVVNIRNNIVNRSERASIFVANNEGSMGKGVISGNMLVDSVKPVTSLVLTKAGDAVSANTLYRQLAVTIRNVGSVQTGFLIRVTKNGKAQNFTSAVAIIDYLRQQLAGTVNQAPVVVAGTDQSLTMPANSAVLAGAASDPDGSIVQLKWQKLTGPAAGGTIDNADKITATVRNLVEGTYTFELKATDNQGSVAYDTVQVKVVAASAKTAGEMNTLTVYPTVVQNTLTWKLEKPVTTSRNGRLNIYYSNGGLYHTESVSPASVQAARTINVGNLPSGLYTLEIVFDTLKQQFRFIKQ